MSCERPSQNIDLAVLWLFGTTAGQGCSCVKNQVMPATWSAQLELTLLSNAALHVLMTNANWTVPQLHAGVGRHQVAPVP